MSNRLFVVKLNVYLLKHIGQLHVHICVVQKLTMGKKIVAFVAVSALLVTLHMAHTHVPRAISVKPFNLQHRLAEVAKGEPRLGKPQDIVVMSANYGNLDFVANWVCTSKHLNVNYFVLSLDAAMTAHLRDHTMIPFIDSREFNISAPNGTYDFMTPEFNFICSTRLNATLTILEHGYHVFSVDADTVWIKDPRPYFKNTVHFEFQSDGGNVEFLENDEPCMGFHLLKSSAQSKDMLRKALQMAQDDNFASFDQKYVTRLIQGMRARGEAIYVSSNGTAPLTRLLTFAQLPPLSFPNGRDFFSENYVVQLAAAQVETVAVHANFIVGAETKRQKLHERGLWRIIKQKQTCTGRPDCYGEYQGDFLRCAADNEHVLL
jgi:hypothetical protein